MSTEKQAPAKWAIDIDDLYETKSRLAFAYLETCNSPTRAHDMVLHAAMYIQSRIDELSAPIFQEAA